MLTHSHTNRKISDTRQKNNHHSKNNSNPKTINKILHLQQTLGNQAVHRLIQNGIILPKLSVSHPADSAEIEADAVADKIMKMADSQIQSNPQEISRMPEEEEELLQGKLMRQAGPEEEEELLQGKLMRQAGPEEEEELLQGKLMRQAGPEEEEELLQGKLMRQAGPEEEEELLQGKLMRQAGPEEEELLQGKFESHTDTHLNRLEGQINSAKGNGGSPMDNSTRQFMESRFENDFGDVKIHKDSNASSLNKAVNARAFTTGSDIFFREGQYSPNSNDGKRLLAHELAHVVQQNGSKVQRKEYSSDTIVVQ